MELTAIDRPAGAFQQGVAAADIDALCRRAFGAAALAAVELGAGAYNTTYRVEVAGVGPVILRVAPEPARQYRVDRWFMRNEHAGVPYLAPIAAYLPRTLAADFTHQLIGRDYLFQSVLPGVPAHEGLASYPREQWRGFYRQLGELARRVHGVPGERFGPLIGPAYPTWSGCLTARLELAAQDLDEQRLDAADVRAVAALAAADRATLDEIGEPRLLHGDLWTVNVMLAAGAPEPTITGVFDCDRTSWGDPEADWSMYMAGLRPGTERDGFWTGYGQLSQTPTAVRRRLYYRARDLAESRLERHRLGNHDDVPDTYDQLRAVLAALG